MNFKDIVPVEWSNQRILLTSQLAEFYGCDTNNIKKDFNANRDRFKAGKHYFKLEGAALSAFKASLVTDGNEAPKFGDLQNLQVTDGDPQNLRSAGNGLQISPKTRTLYLWTERGAARHAKMLSTDKAWEVFEELEDNYFNPKPSPAVTALVDKPAAEKKPRKCHDIIAGYAFVYVFLLSNGKVKIGITKRFCARINEIKRATRLSIADIYFTPLMSFDDARKVEKCCKEIFSTQRITGEIFSVDFERACAAVELFVKLVSVKPIDSKLNIATANLPAAEKSK